MSAATKDNWNPQHYSTNASFVFSKTNTLPLFQLLDPQSGDNILDVGCGSGELTLREWTTAVGPEGSVLGVDSSLSMIDAAKKLLDSHATGNARFLVADGHNLTETLKSVAPNPFDKVVSNAALHWMKENPGKVFKEVSNVLKSGGTFAAEMGGFLNIIGVRSALHLAFKKRGLNSEEADPWWFPTPAACQELLEAAGFRVESIELVPRPTTLNETGLKGWLENFGEPWFKKLKKQEEKSELIDELSDMLRVDMCDEKGIWTLMYVRLRFKAVKE
ncbi:S-adenosyl-L-methionine-dependent methyltransferase [Atractiella rhizophila]|nr:S-adenosyl-L-methionine-dependent methyltransferase [Atractiella rhizophila]